MRTIMQYITATLALAALLAAGPLAAQDQTEGTEAPAEETEAGEAPAEAPAAGDTGLSAGQAVDENGNPLGEAYLSGEHGDWQVRCIRSNAEKDPCQLYQLLEDSSGGSVAEITIFPLNNGGEAVAGATVVTPLETLLTEQITVQVDAGQARRYPFSFCTEQGCVSRIGLTEENLASFRAGSRAVIRIVPAAAPDKKVDLTLSLSGFTAGFAALTE